MGANFKLMTMKAEKTRDEVKSRFEDKQHEDRHENGHSYSGGFGMASGLTFRDESFPSMDDAEDWLSEYAQKWGDALCVKLTDGTWVIGAWCSS